MTPIIINVNNTPAEECPRILGLVIAPIGMTNQAAIQKIEALRKEHGYIDDDEFLKLLESNGFTIGSFDEVLFCHEC